MVYITKRVKFSSSHRLHNPELSDFDNKMLYGKCGDSCTHGHNYVLEVTVRGVIDERSGMLVNVQELKKIIEERIVKNVDHKYLNSDVPFLAGVIPTMENLVVEFWKMLINHIPEGCILHKIKLYETENNFAEYFGE